MINTQKIVFRADGNSQMGLGHILRSSALADAIRANYYCILATRCKMDTVLKEMILVFDEIVQLPELDTNSESKSFSHLFGTSDLIVLDGYNFDTEYQKNLSNQGFSFFCIDDIHAFKFYSKAIINHSGSLTPLDYIAEPSTQFYLGPKYALLRSKFLNAAKIRKRKVENKNCFICFGGADPNNKTLEVISRKNILESPLFENFSIVVGEAYLDHSSLEDFIKDKPNISLYKSLGLDEMVSTMSNCSYAICSPSTVVYEYMSVGGIVFLEQIADNQKDVIRFLTEDGFAFTTEQINQINELKIQDALNKQTEVFDGNSGERLKKIFDQYFLSKNLSIRKAKSEDLNLCYGWANDVEVRTQSYNNVQISLEDHTAWFNSKLDDQNTFFYILEINEKPVAQIRFQVKNNEAVLGYLTDKGIRNKGLGTTILSKGLENFIADYKKAVTITGFVKSTNMASRKIFERLAFRKSISFEYPDSLKYQMHYGH